MEKHTQTLSLMSACQDFLANNIISNKESQRNLKKLLPSIKDFVSEITEKEQLIQLHEPAYQGLVSIRYGLTHEQQFRKAMFCMGCTRPHVLDIVDIQDETIVKEVASRSFVKSVLFLAQREWAGETGNLVVPSDTSYC